MLPSFGWYGAPPRICRFHGKPVPAGDFQFDGQDPAYAGLMSGIGGAAADEERRLDDAKRVAKARVQRSSPAWPTCPYGEVSLGWIPEGLPSRMYRAFWYCTCR